MRDFTFKPPSSDELIMEHDPKPDTLLGQLLAKEPRIRLLYSICANSSQVNPFIQAFVPTKRALYIANGLPNVEHEVAHWLESSPERSNLIDWGQSTDNYVSRWANGGGVVPSPKKRIRLAVRELNVRAIQWHFRSEKFDPDAEQFTRFIKLVQAIVPFGKFKTPDDVREWGHQIVNSTYSQWSEERVRHTFDMRLASLREWMDTEEKPVYKLCEVCSDYISLPSNLSGKLIRWCSKRCYHTAKPPLPPTRYIPSLVCKECMNCGNNFHSSSNRPPYDRFCSTVCHSSFFTKPCFIKKAVPPKNSKECQNCHLYFEPNYKLPNQRFCSHKCYQQWFKAPYKQEDTKPFVSNPNTKEAS
jgi:hypothetical protein